MTFKFWKCFCGFKTDCVASFVSLFCCFCLFVFGIIFTFLKRTRTKGEIFDFCCNLPWTLQHCWIKYLPQHITATHIVSRSCCCNSHYTVVMLVVCLFHKYCSQNSLFFFLRLHFNLCAEILKIMFCFLSFLLTTISSDRLQVDRVATVFKSL